MVTGIILLDNNFNVIGVDEQITPLFGYEASECFGQPLSFFIPHFDKDHYLAEQGSSDTREKATQGKTKTGAFFSLKYFIHSVSQQDNASYAVSIDVISTVFSGIRQKSLLNKAEGHEWISYLLRASPVVIYSCVPSGDFAATYISQNINALTGYTPEQYLSSPSFWLDHLHPDDKDELLTEMEELFNGNESHSYEYRFLCANGDYIWILDKLKISRNAKGEPIEMMGLWLDITDRKMGEESLASSNLLLNKKTEALAESNAELSQFTYVVSHDLKAPLRAIHSYCDWLSEDLEGTLELEQQEYISGMQNAVQQAETLIDDLLELSRVGRRAAEPETIHLTHFFNDLTRSIITDDSVRINIMQDMPVLEVSLTVLTQVFQNLITNAYNYNTSEQKTITIAGREEDDSYIISVTDNGIGIDPKFHERIFQLFQRLHTKEEYDGTGIGLTIVHKAVTHLNWQIVLDSALNEGATFSIKVPINEVKR